MVPTHMHCSQNCKGSKDLPKFRRSRLRQPHCELARAWEPGVLPEPPVHCQVRMGGGGPALSSQALPFFPASVFCRPPGSANTPHTTQAPTQTPHRHPSPRPGAESGTIPCTGQCRRQFRRQQMPGTWYPSISRCQGCTTYPSIYLCGQSRHQLRRQ